MLWSFDKPFKDQALCVEEKQTGTKQQETNRNQVTVGPSDSLNGWLAHLNTIDCQSGDLNDWMIFTFFFVN